GVGADVCSVRRELDGVPGRLRAAVHRDLKTRVRGLDEEFRRAEPLLVRQEEAFAGRAKRQQPVDAAGVEKIDVGSDRRFVERLARVLERSQRRGKCASQPGPNSKLTRCPACGSNATTLSCG